MSPHLSDAELKIAVGDSTRVRAAKVSLQMGRRLKEADDPDMVRIVTDPHQTQVPRKLSTDVIRSHDRNEFIIRGFIDPRVEIRDNGTGEAEVVIYDGAAVLEDERPQEQSA